MTRAGLAAAGALVAALAAPADAHRLSPAYFGFTEQAPGVFEVRFKVSISGGLVDALAPQIPEVCSISAPVRSYTVDDARVQIGEIDCGDAGLRGAVIDVAGLEGTDTDVLVRVDWLDGAAFTHRLVPDAPEVTIPERAGALEVARTYLVIGIEHILFGIDHLLFVLALLLLVEGVGRLVATITAFTLAHSITLAAATLGFVNVPGAPVEATIALSILFLATELARREAAGAGRAPSGGAAHAPEAADRTIESAADAAVPAQAGATSAAVPGAERDDLATRFPWIVAFTFGLLHGFGFAGALSEVGLPADAVPLALLFFNVGVEVGQLVFVAAFVALAALVARLRLPVPGLLRPATVYVVGCVSAFWVIERTLTAL